MQTLRRGVLGGLLIAIGWACALPALGQEPQGVATPQPPAAPVPVAEGTHVHVEGMLTQPLDAGCTVSGVLLVGSRLYVACGEEGIALYELGEGHAPQLLRRGRIEGRALGFVRVGERVFVTSAQTTARPVDELVLPAQTPAANALPLASSPGGAAAPLRTRPRGEVLSASERSFVVSIGALDGVASGDRVAVRRALESVDLEGERASVEETLVVGRVQTTSDHRAEVLLGLNEHAPVGAIAEETTEPLTARLLAPSTARSPFELTATLRPFLPLQDLGLGLLGDLTGVFRYRTLMVRAQLDTVGLSVGLGATRGYFAGSAIFAYEHRYFAVGVGVGLMRNDQARELSGRDWVFGPTLAVTQYARIGERDGLSVAVTNHVALVEDADCRWSGTSYDCRGRDEFHWGALYIDAQVPVMARGWLAFRGGGGHSGMASGEVGFRLLARGNGGAGSIFVTPLVGGAMVRDESRSRLTGPSVALRLEWRP